MYMQQWIFSYIKCRIRWEWISLLFQSGARAQSKLLILQQPKSLQAFAHKSKSWSKCIDIICINFPSTSYFIFGSYGFEVDVSSTTNNHDGLTIKLVIAASYWFELLGSNQCRIVLCSYFESWRNQRRILWKMHSIYYDDFFWLCIHIRLYFNVFIVCYFSYIVSLDFSHLMSFFLLCNQMCSSLTAT